MPKILGGNLEEHRAETARRVFAAFVRLVAEHGYAAVSMADIAREAGVGRTSLYNHFRDKEDILLAYAMDETSRYVADLEQAMAAAASPLERLRIYVREYLHLAESFHFGLGPEVYAVLSPEAGRHIHEHIRVVEDVLRRTLREAAEAGEIPPQDPEIVVPLVHAALQGRRLPTGPDAKDALRTVEAFVLRALGAD